MKTRQVIKNIELLREVKPQKEWAQKTRDLLLSQIQAQEAERKIPAFSFEKAICYVKDGCVQAQQVMVRAFFSRRVGGFVTLGTLLIGTAFASVFSQSSVPGDPLYAVKRTGESVRVAVTSADDRPHIALELVEERIRELELLSQKGLSHEEKNAKTLDSVKNVSNGVSDATQDIAALKFSQEPKKLAAVSSLVTKKTKQYQVSLQKVGKEAGTSSSVQNGVEDALKKVEQVQNKTLEVLVDKKEAVGEKALTEQFQGQIKDVEETIAHITGRVTIAASDTPESHTALQKSQEATKKLQQVKESILKKDFKIALSQLSQSKELISQARQVLQEKEQKGDMQMHIQSEDTPQEQKNKDTVSF